MILNNLPIFYRDHYFWRHKKAESFDLFSLDKQEIMKRKQTWRSQQPGTIGSLTPSTTRTNRHWRALGSDSSWCTAIHVKYTMCNVRSKLLTYGMSFIFRSHPIKTSLAEEYVDLLNENVGSPCYGGYKELCRVLHKYCKTSDRILATGCTCAPDQGRDSSLIEDLYDAGFVAVTGVDNTESDVYSSRERNKHRRPEIGHAVGHISNLKVSKVVNWLIILQEPNLASSTWVHGWQGLKVVGSASVNSSAKLANAPPPGLRGYWSFL